MELIFAAVALLLTFALARLWRGSRAGWAAMPLLVTTAVFARRTIEIRPDVLAMVLWLGCLLALVRAVSDDALTAASAPALFALSGALLGGAIMTNQKLLMAMPAFALAMLWYLVAGKGEWKARLRDGRGKPRASRFRCWRLWDGSGRVEHSPRSFISTWR